ncbi:hypothetical protein LWI29_000049 [Acer saccharum]|uniref:F-box domain-containing protein n=1 Tax=Acer saccharum TaxID=4024 RepID=A0AA39RZZ3_ACESA|nr:hypothetical protein LWI29_000049 [Acer saccharum]
MTGMLALPEGCIAAVIAFTTPRDACRLACVSTTFRSAADSDIVWDRFLPPEYSSSSSSSSSNTWSALWKKELYFRTCHNLIHNGKMSFWFDLPSGKNCYMISPRELYIQDGDNNLCWWWFAVPNPDPNTVARLGIHDSRFSEVVSRRDICPFEICGKVNTSLLSPITTYVAYLVFGEISVRNVDDDPVEVVVGFAGSSNGQSRTIYFHRLHQDGDNDGFYPKKREDGWVESELGEFFNGGDHESELLMIIKTEGKVIEKHNRDQPPSKKRRRALWTTKMLALPQGCIAAVISFTTPSDACRLACVSTTFRSAADSDIVWDRFLPPEYSSSSSSSSSNTWSALWKKELYFRTCHNLIHNGKMSFWFDLPSGKNCYMISPREFYIQDGDCNLDWCWFAIPNPDPDLEARHGLPDSRFSEAVGRRDIGPFVICGKITASLLSPMTSYVAYLVFGEISVCNVDDDPVEVTIGFGSSNSQSRTIYFHREHQDGDDDGFYPKKRKDGWVESELGEFFNGDHGEGEWLMTIKTRGKEYLIILGIEIRPKRGIYCNCRSQAIDRNNRKHNRDPPPSKKRRCGIEDDRDISPKKSFSSLVMMAGMLALPQGCIAAVIAFTTPRDAYRLACVSTTFRSAADSNIVWDCFLPPEYSSSSSSSSNTWSALWKKELYFRTCHNLIHNGKMSFWFDLPSGKNCYMISPRELYIQDGDNNLCWWWFAIPNPDPDTIAKLGLPDSRFSEVVTHRDICPFEICGKVNTSLLSPMTTYVAYLVFGEINVCNVDDDPIEVVVGFARSSNGQSRTIYFHREHQDRDDDGFYPKKREDGWVESELGEFFNGGNEESELLMTLKTKGKSCLIILGIEIRPKKE